MPPGPPVLDLGLQASTIPSQTALPFTNPLSSQATVTAGPASGPFALDPADLPATLDAGATATLGVLFTPAGAGPVAGTIVVVFDGTAGHGESLYEVRAVGETVSWGLVPPTLDFGAVEVGESADREISLLNASNLSPVTFTGVAPPPGGFSIVGNPFPLTVAPGGTAFVAFRYAPVTGGIHDGVLRLGPADLGGSVDITVIAEAIGAGSEQVTDYGQMALDAGGRTPLLSVSVPADAISLFLEGESDSGFIPNTIGLDLLTGPGGKVYENTSSTGDYVWIRGLDVFATQVPNTDRLALQLVPGGGTYQFRLKRLSGFGSSIHVRAIVERRTAGTENVAVLPLNVFLAHGIAPTAATASSDAFLQAVLSRVDTILSQDGIRVGDIDYYDITEESYDEVLSESEFYDLLETSAQASEVRMNLFFVKVALGGGIVGVSASICGPRQNGTRVSGVMSVYSGYSSTTIGLIATHEMGHYLGLYHPVEQDGSHDFIDDTPECPPTGTNAECPTPGAGLLMHWLALGGTIITDGQALVIRGHPHMEPYEGGARAFGKPRFLDPADTAEFRSLPEGWCGTCRRLKKQDTR